METKNQKWTESAMQDSHERFIAIAFKMQAQIMELSANFHFNEFIDHAISKSKLEEWADPMAYPLAFIESFLSFYTSEDLSRIYETLPDEYIELRNTVEEFKQYFKDRVIINDSLPTIDNLIRKPIYCN